MSWILEEQIKKNGAWTTQVTEFYFKRDAEIAGARRLLLKLSKWYEVYHS